MDTLGLVLPSLKAPHSGWPLDAHPPGSLASLSRSDQPIAASGPAQRLRLRLGHREDDRRGDHRLVVRCKDVRPVVRSAVVAKQLQPGRRRRRPRIRRRAPGRVPAGLGESRLDDAGGHCVDRDAVAAAVHLTIGGVVSLGDLTHQGGLLDGRRDNHGGAPCSRGVGIVVMSVPPVDPADYHQSRDCRGQQCLAVAAHCVSPFGSPKSASPRPRRC